MIDDHPIARRAVIKTVGLGLGAGLAAGLPPRSAQAQAAATAAPSTPGALASASDIWSAEYWTNKGEVKLNLWRKRVGEPAADEPPRPVLFLVHGSSNSTRTSYDLAVPGKGEYSLMNVFARYGFDVWTIDHEGYGRSSRTSGNSDIASGVEDLKAAMDVVMRQTARQKMHFFGTSSGAIRAGAFAQVRPEHVDRLVLSAFTYKGEGSPTLKQRAERLEYYRTHNTRLRDRAMIRSIFTRDGLANSYDPAVADALADEELKYGDQVPTGTYLDMTANLPLVDPKKVQSPVLLIRGEHDGIATVADLIDFYQQLPNGDRQFVILPNVAHSPVFSINRHLLWHVVREFLTMPAAVAS